MGVLQAGLGLGGVAVGLGVGGWSMSLPSCWEGSSTCRPVGSHQILQGPRSINEVRQCNLTLPKLTLLTAGQANTSGGPVVGGKEHDFNRKCSGWRTSI